MQGPGVPDHRVVPIRSIQDFLLLAFCVRLMPFPDALTQTPHNDP